MDGQPASPEKFSEMLTWEQYEHDTYSLISKYKQTHGMPRTRPLAVQNRIPQPSGSDSEYYRYQFNERHYGFFVRIRSGNEPKVDENYIVGKEWHEIDTSVITGVPVKGVNELVLKFYKSQTVKSHQTKPVMEVLFNPSSNLLERELLVEETKIAQLATRQKRVMTNTGELIMVDVSSGLIEENIDKSFGEPLPHWHPSHNLDFANRAWEVTMRAIKG